MHHIKEHSYATNFTTKKKSPGRRTIPRFKITESWKKKRGSGTEWDDSMSLSLEGRETQPTKIGHESKRCRTKHMKAPVLGKRKWERRGARWLDPAD